MAIGFGMATSGRDGNLMAARKQLPQRAKAYRRRELFRGLGQLETQCRAPHEDNAQADSEQPR